MVIAHVLEAETLQGQQCLSIRIATKKNPLLVPSSRSSVVTPSLSLCFLFHPPRTTPSCLSVAGVFQTAS